MPSASPLFNDYDSSLCDANDENYTPFYEETCWDSWSGEEDED